MNGSGATAALKTDRLELCRPDVTYAGKVLEYLNANRQAHQPWQPLRDEGYFTHGRQRQLLQPDASSVRYVIFHRGDRSRMIGDIHFSNIIHGFLSACFLGYSMDYRKYGRGYMTEALEAAIPQVFCETGLHRISAHIMPSNAASVRIVEKLGFEREGYFRDYLKINGKWEDHLAFSRLAAGRV